MMRGKGVIFLILSAALLLWSCAVTDADPTDYAVGEFIALISGRAGEVNFSATLSASAADGEGARSFSLTLTAPESLNGLRVEGDTQRITVFLRDLAVYEGETDSLPTVKTLIEAFTPTEAPLSVSAVKGYDAGLPQYETVTLLRFTFGQVCIDPNSDDPIMIKALPRGEGFDLIFTVDSFTE